MSGISLCESTSGRRSAATEDTWTQSSIGNPFPGSPAYLHRRSRMLTRDRGVPDRSDRVGAAGSRTCMGRKTRAASVGRRQGSLAERNMAPDERGPASPLGLADDRFPFGRLDARDLRPVATLPRAGNVHFATVLGDRPTGDVQAVLLELPDQFVVAVGLRFVLGVDDFLELQANGSPRPRPRRRRSWSRRQRSVSAGRYREASESICRRRPG